MNTNRREFLSTASAVSAGLILGNTLAPFSDFSQTVEAAENAGGTYRTRIHKSLIGDKPSDELCQRWKTAGIEGMETTQWRGEIREARALRLIAEKHDFPVHSVMRGWAEFNHRDAAVVKNTIEETKHAIRYAAAIGAETVLLVPCRTGGMAMPAPWDFDIEFDEKNLHVKTVAAGDNSQYADYIKVQNDSTDATIKAMEQIIPVAAEEGVIVALENVWNNLWCTPEFSAALIRYFKNPWVKGYLDLGNHTKYSRAEQWIVAWSHQIVKLHIKGYKITQELGKRGGGEGDWCAIDQASIDWKTLRKLLDDVNYNGWVSVEEGNYDAAKYSKILDAFISGSAETV